MLAVSPSHSHTKLYSSIIWAFQVPEKVIASRNWFLTFSLPVSKQYPICGFQTLNQVSFLENPLMKAKSRIHLHVMFCCYNGF